VKKRQESGETAAAISDYKGKVLGDLEPLVTPYLQLKDLITNPPRRACAVGNPLLR